MKTKIDIETWERKEHLCFFTQFEEPFFGVCVNVDCTRAYQAAKEKNASFFLYYLHASLVAVNQVEHFRYRIAGDEVFVYDVIHASPTVSRNNNATFGIAYIEYKESFEDFVNVAKEEMEKVQNATNLLPANTGENIIHYSSIPWIHFTSLSHARNFKFKDCIPKISFGKMIEENGKKIMPVSIHVHHALMDGYHVALYLEQFQKLLNR